MLVVALPVPALGALPCLAAGKLQQQGQHLVPVKVSGVTLVSEAHQALVASLMAILVLIGSALIEMAPFKSDPRKSGDRIRLVHESAENTGSTLRGLVDQDGLVLSRSYLLSSKFGLFDLEFLLAAT